MRRRLAGEPSAHRTSGAGEVAAAKEGLRFASMITDDSGYAAELLSSLKRDGKEKTVIPTYGVSVGGRMFLHYMSVPTWGSAGTWELNHSGFAYSDDDGQTWVKDPRATGPADSNFGQVALVPVDSSIYAFGIPGGRLGGVQLARVAAADLLRLEAYDYWDGRSWTPDPAFVATLVPAPAGELSVRWSPAHPRWLMMYLNEARSAIVMRTAPNISGRRGAEHVVATQGDYPHLYGPYMVPADTGRDVYFAMSQYDAYEVYRMKATVE